MATGSRFPATAPFWPAWQPHSDLGLMTYASLPGQRPAYGFSSWFARPGAISRLHPPFTFLTPVFALLLRGCCCWMERCFPLPMGGCRPAPWGRWSWIQPQKGNGSGKGPRWRRRAHLSRSPRRLLVVSTAVAKPWGRCKGGVCGSDPGGLGRRLDRTGPQPHRAGCEGSKCRQAAKRPPSGASRGWIRPSLATPAAPGGVQLPAAAAGRPLGNGAECPGATSTRFSTWANDLAGPSADRAIWATPHVPPGEAWDRWPP